MERKTAIKIAVALACMLLLGDDAAVDERLPSLERRRLNWHNHSQLLLNEGQFRQYYRMSFRSFEKLLLRVDESQSCRRTRGDEPLSPVNKLQMSISWLAGYSFHPVRALAGASKPAFYISIHQVMNAIQAHDELQLQFPKPEYEQRESANVFARLVNTPVLIGSVEVNRVSSFFSGHYQRYGVNVQHHSRFTAVTTASPGGMGDALAFTRWELSSIVESFPVGLYLVGANAYSNGNALLTPFTRPQTASHSKTSILYRDSFNFHLIQLRIRVEMAFWLLK
ncbi:hypothetical protein PHMEG_00020882 [Phytophthora megakarya]|uniref:DDE Tnp4 domain-containing protein n=1 Tax=Phytophthora megakarya TaxID=4795 RepID=A0A225VPX5_9STRA|nr:hypothetical protein PHMEG_00020882 [Phytophthora megakarya]